MADRDPILLDFPDYVETERLKLRAPRPGDGAIIYASIVETLEDLRRFPASMPWAIAEQQLDEVEIFCRRGAAGWITRSDLPMLIFRKDDGEHVGNCGLHRFSWPHRVFEIGWWCRKRMQGKGYITEAVRALTGFAFAKLGARRVWCGADDGNEKSRRVAERAGFVYEGTLRSERTDPDGTRRDMRVYAITR